MPRSISKGAFVDDHLLKKVEQMNQTKDRKIIKTWSRRSTVIPDGVSIQAYEAASTIRVGASRLQNGKSGPGSFRCVVSYAGNFFELGKDCLPLP